MNERERLMDEIAALALGILPADEAQRLRRQIALDEELFAEYEAYRGVADLVGFAAEPDGAELDELSSARMKSKIMRSVRAQSAQSVSAAPQPAGMAAVGRCGGGDCGSLHRSAARFFAASVG